MLSFFFQNYEEKFKKETKITKFSASKTVNSSSLPFEGVNNVHGGDSFSSGMLSVCNCVSDDSLQKAFEDDSGVFVDKRRDSLDATSSGKSPDGRFGDSFHDSFRMFPVGCPLAGNFSLSSNTFSAFSDSSHCRFQFYYNLADLFSL